MRYSVLLPTRNGAHLLGACIRSVLDQPYADLELVVSDNANDDGTSEVIASIDDERLKVVRLESPVPVTENWNAALNASSGDFLLMIGDDDFVLPGYFAVADALLERHGEPDCLSYNAFRHITADAIPGAESSYFGEPYFAFEPAIAAGGVLDRAFRYDLVGDAFRFRIRFPLTMQVTLVARKALDRLPGELFRSAFPDHYALGALMLTAERWVYSPIQPIVVGVSGKSFGHFFFNSRDERGLGYLGIDGAFEGRLPGNDVLNVLWTWLLELKRDFPLQLTSVDPDRGEYVVRQLWYWYQEYRNDLLSASTLASRVRLLSATDWRKAFAALCSRGNAAHAFRVLRLERPNRTQPLWGGLQALPPTIRNVAEFASWLQATGRLGGFERARRGSR